jgi:puromycin-sensitive aminopeptidase
MNLDEQLPVTASFRLPRFAHPRRYELDLEPNLDEASFVGHVVIQVDLSESTDVLVLNCADLAIGSARLSTPDGQELDGRVTIDETEQQLFVHFPDRLEPGEGYRLEFHFRGVLNDQLHGFYRSSFRDQQGVERFIATTQFEPSDARRAFPCWDEPDFKAVFKISLIVDDSMVTLSNADEESVERLDAHRRRVTFADTMVMSSYLVAFIVGPYELTEPVLVDGVPVRVVAVPGKSHLAGYAVRAAIHALNFLSRYFEIPYPGRKIDHIAVPDFAFGAMENLGCVTYRESVLLADESLASQAELQRIALVVAHETAHMWFGNLVTMKWWNGIWLNEAFATFMENLAIDDFAPEWQSWTAFQASKSQALSTDALHATRPVEYAVGRPEEAEAMFDVLTYQKGGAVVRMLEQYLGPEVFRKGLSRYLSTNAYRNTETADLWNAIEVVSGEPVKAIMDSWILRPGYPLIEIETTGEPGEVRLRQRQFRYSESSADSSVADGFWTVPVTIRASVFGAVQQHRMILDRDSATYSFDGPVDWVVINDGAWGFYRSRYSPELRERLISFGVLNLLDPLERFGLISDSWATVMAGTSELQEWVATVSFVTAEEDPDVWTAMIPVFNQLSLVADTADQPALDALISRLADPVWQRLGWEPRPGESQRTAMARARVLAALSSVTGPSTTKREAAERFLSFLDDPSVLAPDLVGVAARTAVRTLGSEGWTTVLNAYRSAQVPQDKLRYLNALAETSEVDLLLRMLDLSMTNEVRTQEGPALMAAAMGQRGASPVVWEWVERNWDQIEARYPNSLLIRAIEGVTAVVDDDLADAVEWFCRSKGEILSGPRIDQIIERMWINVALRRQLRGTLSSALTV